MARATADLARLEHGRNLELGLDLA
jgi:hypothetical protein